MKPYFQTKLGTLYNADCRDIVSEFPADTIITDPIWPNAAKEFDCDDPKNLLLSCLDMIHPQVDRLAIHLGCDSDPRFLTAVNPKRWSFFRVCWMRYIAPGYKGRLLVTSDIIYLFGPPPRAKKGQHLIPGYYEDTSSDGKQAKDHPCPRKLSHVKWQINWWSQDEDIILDPFIGSGTTAVACEYLNRRWIGIEINEKYCEIAVRRIEHERKQKKLFRSN